RLKLGLTWLFSYRGIPIVYYGTEIAMPGKNDPYNRDDFPWGKEQNTDVRDLVTKLNKIRSEHAALRRGKLENLQADQNTYAFARILGEEKVVTVLNNHASEAYTGEVDVSTIGLSDGSKLVDQLSGKSVTVSGGKLKVDLAARSGAIYTQAPKAPLTYWLVGGLVVVATGFVVGFLLGRRRGRMVKK
ncbi:MAG TPA: DUF1966 domain-containing protein, partial [Symbiobacteriaceae bacterium]|nr:DUF1966 domain-containing protein [Symbiobacteriaceae bacterium]